MNGFRDKLRPAINCVWIALVVVGLCPSSVVAQTRVRFPTAEETAAASGQSFPVARTAYAGDVTLGDPLATQYGAPPTSARTGATLSPSLLDSPIVPQTLGYQSAVQPNPSFPGPAYVPPPVGYGVANGTDPWFGNQAPGNNNPNANQKLYGVVEAFWLMPNLPTNQSLVLNQNTLNPVLNIGSLEYQMEPGVRAAIGYAITCDYTVEGLYFGLNNWSSVEGTRGGANNLRLPGALGLALDDFFGADYMQVNYTTSIQNAEINLWRRFDGTHLTGMIGFRYVNWQETMNIHTIDSDADQSDYHVSANNNLYGGQLGAQYDWIIGSLELQLLGKGGVFGNMAKQTQSVADNNNAFPVRNTSASATNVAFVGEAGLNGLVKLSNNWFLRGGYTAIWLVDVARAPDQLDFTFTATSGTTLSAKQTAFMHGPSIGLQGQW